MNPYILNYLKLSLCIIIRRTQSVQHIPYAHIEKERREIEGEKRKEGRRKREREQ